MFSNVSRRSFIQVKGELVEMLAEKKDIYEVIGSILDKMRQINPSMHLKNVYGGGGANFNKSNDFFKDIKLSRYVPTLYAALHILNIRPSSDFKYSDLQEWDEGIDLTKFFNKTISTSNNSAQNSSNCAHEFEISQLENQLNTANMQLENASGRIKKLGEENLQLSVQKEEMQKRERELQALAQENAATIKQLLELVEIKSKQLGVDKEKLIADKNELQGRVQVLTAANERLTMRNGQLQQLSDQGSTFLRMLREQNDQLRDQNAQLSAENTRLKAAAASSVSNNSSGLTPTLVDIKNFMSIHYRNIGSEVINRWNTIAPSFYQNFIEMNLGSQKDVNRFIELFTHKGYSVKCLLHAFQQAYIWFDENNPPESYPEYK